MAEQFGSGSMMNLDEYLDAEWMVNDKQEQPEGMNVAYNLNWTAIRSNALSVLMQQLNTVDWEKLNDGDDFEKVVMTVVSRAAYTGFSLENTLSLMQGEHDLNVSESLQRRRKRKKK